MRTLLALLALLVCPLWLHAESPPNFIIINCDDLGYADLGCFGSELHRTPRIDSLAQTGMKLTSYYVTSGVCSPSRSSLMTGCYPRRVDLHMDHKGAWVLFPRSEKGLHPEEITIAEVLKQAGYATAIVGKWHLGDQPEFLPTRQGFDQYFGIPYSNDMGRTDRPDKRYPPLPLLRNEIVIEQEPDQRLITQRYTEEAVSFLRQHADQKFFLYLPHTMPHWPQYSSEAFAGKSKNGKWGDAVEEIDWSTGVILDTLEELQLTENTFIVFMSDNGGAVRHGAKNTPLKGGKGSTDEGGMRVCCLVKWPGGIQPGSSSNALLTSMDWLPTFAKLAGTQPPQDRIIDGKNILPVLTGETETSPHDRFLYYKIDTLECIRVGPWKLKLAAHTRNGRQQAFVPKLFNLESDLSEATNVADQHPEVVDRLMHQAELARLDLGDGKQRGQNQRIAGRNPHPRALTDPQPAAKTADPEKN